jgi:hypothetical protein
MLAAPEMSVAHQKQELQITKRDMRWSIIDLTTDVDACDKGNSG